MHTVKFPTDRIVFFSDAVFAIAITLLVIEIKVPDHETMHRLGGWGVLMSLEPLFIGFVVSFLVTALFWRAHLIICHYVKEFDNRLLWLNMWLLLFVAMMPFSTAFYSENFGSNDAFIFYCLNVATIGFMSYFIVRHIIKKENLTSLLGEHETRWMKQRAMVVPLVFLCCIALTFISPLFSRMGPILIFVVQLFRERIHKRKAKKIAKAA